MASHDAEWWSIPPLLPSKPGAGESSATGVSNLTSSPGAAGVVGAASSCVDPAPMVATFLGGPVRSLLMPSVHRTIGALFWDALGGTRVLFARLYDVHLLDVVRRCAALFERTTCTAPSWTCIRLASFPAANYSACSPS